MKRLNSALVIIIMLVSALLPMSAYAAPEFKYNDDQSAGLIIYSPTEDYHQYVQDSLKFEFDVYIEGRVGLDAFLMEHGNASNIKRFDIMGAVKQEGSDRYTIELDISDMPAGDYTLVFGLVSGGQVVTETRNIHIIPGRWDSSGGNLYYYTNGAYAKDCWQRIAGKWYRFDAEGIMLTGWRRLDERWYYFGEKGGLYTGWQQLDGKWYCFGESGAMFENCWVVTYGKWYMVDKKGVMLTGWQKDGGKFYYMDQQTGEMQTGWLRLDDKWYYLLPSGAMATGAQDIDGTQYRFDRSGILLSK